MMNKDVNSQMQGIILHQKELNQRWDNIGSFIEGMIKEYPETPHKATTNSNYLKYKKYIRERRNQKFQPITKAILYDKYIANKARIVTKKREDIKIYEVKIRYINYRKTYFVKYQGKWQKLRDIAEELRKEGVILGFRNIINTLRSRHNKTKQNNEGRNTDNKNGKIYTNTQMSD